MIRPMDAPRWGNVLQLDREYGAAKVELTGRPLEAYVEVAARCNLRCRMCPIIVDPRYQPGSGYPGLMADYVFESLVPIFPTLKRAYLFGLGEPTLHPRLVEWVHRAAAAGVEVWVTTNATLIDQAKADALAQAGLARVSVSIDGGTAETYERIRRRGHWQDVVRGIAALGEAKRRFGNPRIYFNVVAMASNLQELPQILELCARHNGDGVFLESLYAYEHPVIEEFVAGEHLGHLGRERVDEIVAAGHRYATELGIELSTRIEEQETSGRFAGKRPVEPTTGAATAIAGGAGEALVEIGGNGGARSGATAVTLAPPEMASMPASLTVAPPSTPVSLPSQLRMPWLCSEPWATVNVNSAGEVRACCFNNQVLGVLGHQSMVDIWNGAGYGGLRGDMVDNRAPVTCTACVQQKRVKRNPYLGSLGTPPRVAEASPMDAELLLPAAGELVGHPLVVLGRVTRRAGGGDPRKVTTAELPEAWLDGTRIAELADFATVRGDRFVAALPMEFVLEGAHSFFLCDAEGRKLASAGPVPLHSGAAAGERVYRAVERLAVPLFLQRHEPEPALEIDGVAHPIEEWFGQAHYDVWVFVAVVDVTGLPPGRHTGRLQFRRHLLKRGRQPDYTFEVDRVAAPR
jgi:MoaA/NifB/PqqE/SkfB family radical SAM enzyme